MKKPTNLKVGDKFRVIEGDSRFNVGDIVTLKEDDGSNWPYFWNADKSDWHCTFFSSLEPVAKTVRDVQVDDIVIGKTSGCEHVVLERGQRTVLLSQANNFKNSMGNYTFDRLEEFFTLKAAPEVVDDNIVLTMNEIAEKLGVDASKLKIKKE